MCENNPNCHHHANVEADVRARIERYKWTYIGVLTEGARAPFVYTVGLTARGLPELLIEERDHRFGQALLGAAADLMISDPGLFVDGSHISVTVDDAHHMFHIVGNTTTNYKRAAFARRVYGPEGKRVSVLELGRP